MKNKIRFALLFLLGFVLGLVLIANDVRAQQSASNQDMTKQAGVLGRNGVSAGTWVMEEHC